jgi:hypothetical protein
MLFLIEYDRNQGRIVTLNCFADSDRTRAEESRLQLEIKLNLQRASNEVVILEASTEQALRRTHRRYFEDLAEIATMPAE